MTATELITPTAGTTTPQGFIVDGKISHAALDLYTPAHGAQLDKIMRTSALITPAQFEAQLVLHLGYAYGFWDRCGGTHHEHDCSGYQCWAANELGLAYGCVSSFVIAQWCWDAGLIISEEEALVTPCFAFHGPNGGRGPSHAPNGSDGHIVYCNVKGFGGTLEAMGHAYGVVRGSFYNRNWVAYSRIPGLSYLPPKPKVEPQFMPALQLAARLHSPDGGWWEAYTNGLVDYLDPKGQIVHGGMTSPADQRAFAGRQIAQLLPRSYGSPKRHGYTIVATSGEKYVPSAQH